MHIDEKANYRCPETKGPLRLQITDQDADNVLSGFFLAENGKKFPIDDGLPNLTFPTVLSHQDQNSREFYNQRVDQYDKYLHLTFETFWEDETTVRNGMIDLLRLQPNHVVLEVSAGTGRDSALIASRLSPNGKLYLQDISPSMLLRCRDRLQGSDVPIEFSLSNGCYLPYPDKHFDAVFHFGGIGEFSDIPRALSEFSRVTKIGGRVVLGDESMPPWLRGTRFSKIMSTTNPQFEAELPLRHLPVTAREVHLRWIIGGVFYLIDFTVGEGEPTGNFSYEIPGPRGGTHLTRVDGQLEGVTPATKALAQQAAAAAGMSMHQWLNDIVNNAATAELKR